MPETSNRNVNSLLSNITILSIRRSQSNKGAVYQDGWSKASDASTSIPVHANPSVNNSTHTPCPKNIDIDQTERPETETMDSCTDLSSTSECAKPTFHNNTTI